MAGIILSADIGSSSLKAALIDTNGKLKAMQRAVYRQHVPGVDAWESAFIKALEGLHSQFPDCVIDAVCFSGNGPTLVPVIGDGETLPPIYWNNNEVKQSHQPGSPSLFLPYIAWFKKSYPEKYEKTTTFISSHEGLASRLGADVLTVLPQPSYEQYYWDEEQCRLFDLDRNKFPPFVKTGCLMGHVSQAAAAFFGPYYGGGLKSGTPIIAGGPDFITALIGTDTLRPGELNNRTGSSEGINYCSDTPVQAKDLRTLPHIKEGLWNIGFLISSSGSLFEQYRHNSGQDNRSYRELIEELIPNHYIKTADLQTLLSGSDNESITQGRMVLYNIAMTVRTGLETLKRNGFKLNEMRVSGVQGRNQRWNQLKADITGIPLLIPEIYDGELAGNAVLAAAALGIYPSVEEAAGLMVRFKEVFKPRFTNEK